MMDVFESLSEWKLRMGRVRRQDVQPFPAWTWSQSGIEVLIIKPNPGRLAQMMGKITAMDKVWAPIPDGGVVAP